MNSCPIGFGDCPDCEFWYANECEHKFFDEINLTQLKSFIELAYEISTINKTTKDMLIDLAEKTTEEE